MTWPATSSSTASCFGYSGAEPVFDGFSLRIRPGERVALVGAVGSGKSTVALLLPRFYDVDGGPVSHRRGRRARPAPRRAAPQHRRRLRGRRSCSPPPSGTTSPTAAPKPATSEVGRRPRRRRPTSSSTRSRTATTPWWGSAGLTLSGGQRQRITLARALLTDPRILVLDDATSSVDPTVEAGDPRHPARGSWPGAPPSIMAHRPSTVALADRVVLVDGGRVVADGTHAQLQKRQRALPRAAHRRRRVRRFKPTRRARAGAGRVTAPVLPGAAEPRPAAGDRAGPGAAAWAGRAG